MDHDPLLMPSATASTLNPHGGHQAAMAVSAPPTVAEPDKIRSPAREQTEPPAPHAKQKMLGLDLDKAKIEKQAQELQEKLASLSKLRGWAIHFSLVPELDRPVIQVIDAETRQVIRQIPSEEMLLMSKRLQSLAQEQGERISLSGLLFDGQV